MNKNSKIYVSGHTGMLGSAMIKKLEREGYINIITRTHSQLDLTRQADVEDFFAIERPEYVFHIAAKAAGVALNKKQPIEFLHEGTLISLNVLNAAHQFGAKGVVYVSSGNVYPEYTTQPIKECQILSGCPPMSFIGYALSKIIGMSFCQAVHNEYGKHFLSAILPGLYGSNDYGTTVIPMLCDKFADATLHKKPSVEIWGTGKARREFIHADDAADALLFLMNNGESGESYNVGSGEEYTIADLAQTLQEISGFSGVLMFDSTKPESADRRFLDSHKLYNLGWTPQIAFKEGLKRVYDEHLERVRGQK